MAYTKQTWQDLPSKTTPINASRLGHIEQGIYDAASTADTAASNASSAISGLADKVDKVEGKGLSTNDFTDALQTKLNNIAEGAEVNVQADYAQIDTTADDYIKNKPTLGTASAKNSTSVVTDSTDLVESGAVYTALQGKADNSVIAPVENGSTASQAYAVGSHAIRNGAFITWINAKAQGETINDASDYTSGDVASAIEGLIKSDTFSGITSENGNLALTNNADKVILRVIPTINFYTAELYKRTNGGTGIALLQSSTREPLANTAVTGIYYYI